MEGGGGGGGGGGGVGPFRGLLADGELEDEMDQRPLVYYSTRDGEAMLAEAELTDTLAIMTALHQLMSDTDRRRCVRMGLRAGGHVAPVVAVGCCGWCTRRMAARLHAHMHACSCARTTAEVHE